MDEAIRDYHPGSGALTREPHSQRTYLRTGVFGDAMLARWGKGRIVTEAMVAGILSDIERLRFDRPPPSP